MQNESISRSSISRLSIELDDTQRYLSDLVSEMTGNDFERYLLAKGVNQITVPRGEHHSIGVEEKAIRDPSHMMRSYPTDSNLPGIYWVSVVEHAALPYGSNNCGVAGP